MEISNCNGKNLSAAHSSDETVFVFTSVHFLHCCSITYPTESNKKKSEIRRMPANMIWISFFRSSEHHIAHLIKVVLLSSAHFEKINTVVQSNNNNNNPYAGTTITVVCSSKYPFTYGMKNAVAHRVTLYGHRCVDVVVFFVADIVVVLHSHRSLPVYAKSIYLTMKTLVLCGTFCIMISFRWKKKLDMVNIFLHYMGNMVLYPVAPRNMDEYGEYGRMWGGQGTT